MFANFPLLGSSNLVDRRWLKSRSELILYEIDVPVTRIASLFLWKHDSVDEK